MAMTNRPTINPRPINVKIPPIKVPAVTVNVQPIVDAIRPLMVALDAMSRQNHEILTEIRSLAGKPVKVDMPAAPARPRRYRVSLERRDGEVVAAHLDTDS